MVIKIFGVVPTNKILRLFGRQFEDMRDLDPYRMEFMEYYSTALWHLQVDFLPFVNL